MNTNELTSAAIERLLAFALRESLIEAEDLPYYRNLLLDAMRLDAPEMVTETAQEVPDTAAPLLHQLCDRAVARGIIEDIQTDRELFSARLMGLLTPSPSQVRANFAARLREDGPEAATDDFYHLCRACDYIKVAAIAQNIRYEADTDVGRLEITINLSKPEKDPREIARLKNAPSVGYPRCMLCVENPGYAGRANFPARQNHRMIPLRLAGADWYLQYSPYAYYPEHCIVLNSQHVPMKVDRGGLERLFDFVSQFPHYFLGSNADLPIVGGSILNHDHFQGGRHTFPMDRAGVRAAFRGAPDGVCACVLNWPMSTIELTGEVPERLIDEAVRILEAWRGWSDPACGILAREEDGTPHNTITPILRKIGDTWHLRLVLRNNRTSDQHSLGIFHPHAELHHIKRENIGLIEVMGLFILPGRLKTELALLTPWLTGREALIRPDPADPREKHFDWVQDVLARNGICPDAADAEALIHREVAAVCAQVLRDSGVYKLDARGDAGMACFLGSLGYERAEG